MGTFRSDLPLGTSDATVFVEGNVPNLDEAMNSQQQEWYNRFGIKSLTYKGMQDRFSASLVSQGQRFDNQLASQSSQFNGFMDSSSEEFQHFLDSSGYSGWDTEYAAGIVLNSHNQGFTRCEADGSACLFYTPRGDTPLPYTTTGVWAAESGFFVVRGDDSLRQNLSSQSQGDRLIAAGKRTQHSKNRDIISVRDQVVEPVNGVDSNQSGMVAAISEATAESSSLFWPRGTYVSTDNIPGFWDVNHLGSGAIKRGDDVFFINPKSNTGLRKLYASPLGSDFNDGLTSDFPITLSKAAQIISNFYGLSRWRIVLEGGEYAGTGTRFSLGSTSRQNYVEIFGPDVGGHPNVPLAILNGTSGSESLIDASTGNWIHAKDIKVINSDLGFVVNRGNLIVTNCHSENVKFSLTYLHGSQFTCRGGIYDGSGIQDSMGVRGYYNSTHSILGDSLNSSPLFKNFATGLFITEGCSGHLDFTRVHDCTVGVNFSRMAAGCNTKQMQIYRCGTGVLAINSTWINNVIDFGTGTENACDKAVDLRGDSSEFYARGNTPTRTPRYQGSLIGSFTHSGARAVKWTPLNILSDLTKGGLDVIKIKIVGSSAGSSTLNRILFHLGGIYIGGARVPGNQERYVIDATFFFITKSNIRSVTNLIDSSGATRIDYQNVDIGDFVGQSPLTVSVETEGPSDVVSANFCLCETTIGG